MRLLIVDDNRDAADSLAQALTLLMEPECVAVAYDGLEAVAAISNGLVVDIIVTDVEMPGLTGNRAAIRIRELLRGDAPTIIAMTGNPFIHASPASKVFDRVLMKPMPVPDLIRVLNELGSERGPCV